MENLLKQMRVKFTDAEQENRADLGGIRDHKIPTRKTHPVKDKKDQNWFQRQFLRKMSHDYDSLEIQYATAIAAALFAISSLDFSEQQIKEGPESSLPKTKSKVGSIISLSSEPGGLSKRFSDEKRPEKTLTPVSSMKKSSSDHLKRDDTKPGAQAPRKTPTFSDKKTNYRKPGIPEPMIAPPVQSASSSRPIPPPPPPPPQMRNTSIKPGPVRPPTPPSKRQTPTRLDTNDKKADAWEREELEKIKLRYEKLKETIDSWENKKKAKARRKLEKKERSDSERKRVKAYEKFQSEMNYINGIVGGARAQAEERRRNEELKVKEKANIIRTTGKLPGTCPCF